MTAEKYIVVKDEIIVGCYETTQGEDGIKKSIGNIPYDKIQAVNIEGDHRIKTNVNEYDKNGFFNPMSMRVKDGYVILPEGWKLDGEEIVPMTIEEKIIDGLIELNPLMKAIGNNVIPKTDAELIKDKIKTQAQIDAEKAAIEQEKLIQSEIRKMAMERLGLK